MIRADESAGLAQAIRHARDAERLARRGDLAAAEAAAKLALGLAPDDPVALRIAGSVQRSLGRLDLAEGYLRTAEAIDPSDLRTRRELALCLADRGEVVRSIALLPVPGDAEAWLELGILHDRNADAPAALEAARKAARLVPQHPGAGFLTARALTALGRIDEAAAQYRRLVRVPGQAARAWFGLLDLKSVRVEPEEVRSIERLVGLPSTPDEDRMLAAYALGYAYEQARRPEDAVRAFDAANRRRRAQTPWDARAFSLFVDAIRDAFAGPTPEPSSELGANVVFVLGMPRSGTSLVEQILSAHSRVVGASELPDLGQVVAGESARRGKAYPAWVAEASDADWERLGREYLARTKRWQTRRLFTDKMPENWLYLGAIVRMLPGARIVGCERDPLETCWSCYKQLFAPGRFAWSYDFESLAAYAHDAQRLWRHVQRLEPRRCRTQSHEALVADFEAQVRELLGFVGLDFEPACLDFASARRETRSASAAQVRQPLDRATARRAAYGRALDPLAQALARAGLLETAEEAPALAARTGN